MKKEYKKPCIEEIKFVRCANLLQGSFEPDFPGDDEDGLPEANGEIG